MEIKSYNFSNIKFSDLEDIVQIKPMYNPLIFKEWFSFSYKLKSTETRLFKALIEKNRMLVMSYMEEDLKAKFLIPIFNQVDFMTDTHNDWYDASLQGVVNGLEIKGFTDYMVASGTREPRKPYFFIRQFKPSISEHNPVIDHNPLVQLLAEMLVTIEKNQTNIMRGGYIIGQNWSFVILEKVKENVFQYFVSSPSDALNITDLKKIYIILQAVKHKYCKD